MQKLLIHITILFALILLLCTPSAYGQGTAVVGNPTVTLVGRDYSGIPNSSYIVDLGLDVYWADRNVGASNNTTSFGNYYAWAEKSTRSNSYDATNTAYYDIKNVLYTKYWVTSPTTNDDIILDSSDDAATHNWGQYWHMPSLSDLQSLLMNCDFSNSKKDYIIVKSKNSNASINVPMSGYKELSTTDFSKNSSVSPVASLFWTRTLVSTSSDWTCRGYKAYAFKGVVELTWRGYELKNSVMCSDEFRYRGIPVRPVIDKFVVTYIKNVDGVTTNATINVPNGTKITLTASNYECYDLEWTKVDAQGSESDNGSATKEFTITSNTTITASFTSRKYSVSAYIKYGDSDAVLSSKDENLECGQYATISVPIDNCYVFQGWEGPGITGRLAAGENNNGYSCQVDNSVSPTQASLTIPNIDSNTQLNRDYTAIFSSKTTNIRATTDSNKGWVGLNVWK